MSLLIGYDLRAFVPKWGAVLSFLEKNSKRFNSENSGFQGIDAFRFSGATFVRHRCKKKTDQSGYAA